jgi:uncharacterized protein involved in exopolysaccharide biosynthesis
VTSATAGSGVERAGNIGEFLLAIGIIALRYRTLFVAVFVLVFSTMVVPRLVRPRGFTAEATFVARDRQQAPGGIASLAAQFGVSIGAGATSEGPAFYAALVTSRGILSDVVQAKYDVPLPKFPKGGTLVDIMDVPGSTPEARIETAIRLLRESMRVDVARETGAIRVQVSSGSPRLAAAVLTRIIDRVNDFNVNRRQSQARAERVFTSERMGQAQRELAAAESELQSFLQSNRQIENSPRLQFEQDRLQRNVTLRSQIYSSLAQSFEQARVSEARDISVITLIDEPVPPVSPNRRGLVIQGLKSIGITLALGLFAALVLEFFRRAAERDDAELVSLRRLWRETVDDIRHPVRAIRRDWAHVRQSRTISE